LITRGPSYVFGIVAFVVGLWLIRFIRARMRDRMSRNKVHSSLQPFFLSLAITSLYVLLIISVMNIIGFELTIFTTIIGAFSVAAGLALSGTFQNFAGGVLILLLKPFELDDSIVAQGQDGKVISIQIFYTVLLTADNKTVIIPNGKLFNEVIVNVTREGKRRLDFDVRLSYTADIDKARQIMLDAIKATKNVLTDPASRVGLIGLDNDSIRITVNVWVEPANFLDVKIALMEKIIKDLGAAGITFPKPGA
ncbi:MAG: mechanosensitive ion channel family protein, partial [Mucilaginibacter sp.]|nr:mechanosensitive ion channel family protein [Mucilaginibacter sp.]